MDTKTLYKLMILYMLNKVSFPLSNTQITNFFLEKQYTTYFTIQEAINSLLTDNFIREMIHRNSTQYVLTDEAMETITFFSNKLSIEVKEDINSYLVEHHYELKKEIGTTSDYHRTTDGDYIVHCMVKEGNTNLIELNISVPLEHQADVMCANWKNSSGDIYEFVMKHLMQIK